MWMAVGAGLNAHLSWSNTPPPVSACYSEPGTILGLSSSRVKTCFCHFTSRPVARAHLPFQAHICSPVKCSFFLYSPNTETCWAPVGVAQSGSQGHPGSEEVVLRCGWVPKGGPGLARDEDEEEA